MVYVYHPEELRAKARYESGREMIGHPWHGSHTRIGPSQGAYVKYMEDPMIDQF